MTTCNHTVRDKTYAGPDCPVCLKLQVAGYQKALTWIHEGHTKAHREAMEYPPGGNTQLTDAQNIAKKALDGPGMCCVGYATHCDAHSVGCLWGDLPAPVIDAHGGKGCDGPGCTYCDDDAETDGLRKVLEAAPKDVKTNDSTICPDCGGRGDGEHVYCQTCGDMGKKVTSNVRQFCQASVGQMPPPAGIPMFCSKPLPCEEHPSNVTCKTCGGGKGRVEGYRWVECPDCAKPNEKSIEPDPPSVETDREDVGANPTPPAKSGSGIWICPHCKNAAMGAHTCSPYPKR